jgi:hypothetical protein
MVVVPFLRNNPSAVMFFQRFIFPAKTLWEKYSEHLAENSEAASFLGQTTSYDTEVQEREPWDFYEWITCKEKPRCAPNIFPIM